MLVNVLKRDIKGGRHCRIEQNRNNQGKLWYLILDYRREDV